MLLYLYVYIDTQYISHRCKHTVSRLRNKVCRYLLIVYMHAHNQFGNRSKSQTHGNLGEVSVEEFVLQSTLVGEVLHLWWLS